MHTSPGTPISQQCFTDKSADETLGPWIDVRGKANVTFYVTGNGTTSSGVISYEEAAPKDMGVNGGVNPPPVFGATTGGYSLISTSNASDVTGGLQQAVHLPVKSYFYVRARISTAIGGGGTISVGCVGY